MTWWAWFLLGMFVEACLSLASREGPMTAAEREIANYLLRRGWSVVETVRVLQARRRRLAA